MRSLFTPEQRLEIVKLVRYIMEHKGGSLDGWATLRVNKVNWKADERE